MKDEMKLRVDLYNAACGYAVAINAALGNWDKVSAAADKLERVALEFAEGVGRETVRPEPRLSPIEHRSATGDRGGSDVR